MLQGFAKFFFIADVIATDRPFGMFLCVAHGIRFGAKEGVLKDIAQLGERYDVTVRTITSKRGATAEAVLREAKMGHAMIVIGVSPRPGEDLFFGDTAATVLKDWKNPILLVAS